MELLESDELGRYFVAARDLDAGVVVLSCAALVDAVRPPQDFDERDSCWLNAGPGEDCYFCDVCKQRVFDEAAVCPRCAAFAVCPACAADERGKKALRMHESGECGAFCALAEIMCDNDEDSLGASWVIFVLLIRLACNGDSEYRWPRDDDPWCDAMLRSFLTHESEFGKEERARVRGAAELVEKIVSSSRGSCALSTASLAQWLMIMESNCHTILDCATQAKIGVGLYPGGAFFNHSCTPNVDYLVGQDGVMRKVTIRNVKKGEQLTITYTDLVSSPTLQRREFLEQQFHFSCACQRCDGRACNSYDTALCDPGVHDDEVRALHAAGEGADTVQRGLNTFSAAVGMIAEKKSSLAYKSADGMLIHAMFLEEAKSMLVASRLLLSFHGARDTSLGKNVASSLKVDRVGLLLFCSHAETRLVLESFDTSEGASRERIVKMLHQVIKALSPFSARIDGIKAWCKAAAASRSSLRAFWRVAPSCIHAYCFAGDDDDDK